MNFIVTETYLSEPLYLVHEHLKKVVSLLLFNISFALV